MGGGALVVGELERKLFCRGSRQTRAIVGPSVAVEMIASYVTPAREIF